MRRVIVAGGTGFFGSLIVTALRERNIDPLVAARSSDADLRLDVEDSESIAGTLKPGDLVIDTVGPFHARTANLIDGVIRNDAHLIDLADSISYVRKIYARHERIRKRGLEVRTACSATSTVPAAILKKRAPAAPVKVRGFLAPASKYANYPSTARSLLFNIGQPITVYENGRLVEKSGWFRCSSFDFPEPVREENGYLYESTDSYLLPRSFPSLESVTFYMCPRVDVIGTLLSSLKYEPCRRLADVMIAARRLAGNPDQPRIA